MLSEKIFKLKSTNRLDIRRDLVQLFLKETPGTGTGDSTSKYNYLVEKFKYQGKTQKVILKRPAYLNKGFDFRVTVLGHNFNEGIKSTRLFRENPKKNILNQKRKPLVIDTFVKI